MGVGWGPVLKEPRREQGGLALPKPHSSTSGAQGLRVTKLGRRRAGGRGVHRLPAPPPSLLFWCPARVRGGQQHNRLHLKLQTLLCLEGPWKESAPRNRTVRASGSRDESWREGQGGGGGWGGVLGLALPEAGRRAFRRSPHAEERFCSLNKVQQLDVYFVVGKGNHMVQPRGAGRALRSMFGK